MNDSRYRQLAKLIVDWSIKVKAGEKVLIGCTSPLSLVLAEEVYKKVLRLGAFPYLDIKTEALNQFFYAHANQPQLKEKPEIGIFLANWADKVVNIVAEKNPFELSNSDPKKIVLRQKITKPVKDIILTKPWVLTYLPTLAMAQSARLSLADTVDLYFRSTLQDYAKMKKKLASIKQRLDQVNEIHIQAERTDLKLYFKGRTFQPCVGTHNIPDGEIFSGPLETKTEGHIYFNFPSLRQGKLVEGVYLKFHQGKVVGFDAAKQKKYLAETLSSDSGAKRLGEFAFGLNYGLTDYMYNTLFDEKMGGTIHLALGSSYTIKEDGGGLNESAVHWDLVKDMRGQDAVIKADGKTIYRSGKFLVQT